MSHLCCNLSEKQQRQLYKESAAMSRLPDQSLFLFYESDEDKEECEKPTEEVKRSEEPPEEEAHKEQAKKRASKAALQRSPVLSKDGWERQEQEKAGTKRKEARRKVALRHGMELSDEEEESLPSGFDLSPLSKSNSDILAEASLPPPSLVPRPSMKAARKGDRVAESPVSMEESTASTDILDGLSDAENCSDDDDTHSRKTQTSSKASNKASHRHGVLEKMKETSPGKGKKRKTAENTGTSAVRAMERRKEEATGLLADNAPEATLPAYNSDDESIDFGEEDGEESPLIELSGPSFELPGSTDLDDDLADLQLPKAQETAVSEKETKTGAYDMDVDEDAGETRATQTKKRKRNERESEEEAKESTATKAPLPAAKKRRKEERKEEERASEAEENTAMDVDEGWRDDGTLEDSDLEEMVEESPSEVTQRSQRTKKPSRKAREAEKSDEEDGHRRKRKKPRKSIDTRELSGSSRKAKREREREREVEEEEEEEESSEEESFINAVVRPFSKKLLSKLAEKKRPEINSKLLSGFTFLFTSLDADVAADGALPKNTNAGGRTLKEQLRKLVTLHGGKVANRFVAAGPRGHGYREHSKHKGLCATVLLCPGQQQRTEKFLLALLHGTACLHYSWLVDCCERQTVVDYNADEFTRDAYFVPLGLSLEKGRPVYGYEDEHTAVRQPPDIFKGARCEVVGSESAFVDFWSRTLKAAGAKVVKRLGEPWERDGRGLELVVTESDPTKYLEEQANALNLPVLSAEWVFQCLLARSIVPFFKGSPPEVTHPDYFEISPPPNVRNCLLDIESDTEAEEKAPKTKRKGRER